MENKNIQENLKNCNQVYLKGIGYTEMKSSEWIFSQNIETFKPRVQAVF